MHTMLFLAGCAYFSLDFTVLPDFEQAYNGENVLQNTRRHAPKAALTPGLSAWVTKTAYKKAKFLSEFNFEQEIMLLTAHRKRP